MNLIRTFLSELWQNLGLAKTQTRRVLVALGAVLVSTGIGVRYADEPFIHLFPILLWLYSILVCFAILYPTHESTPICIKLDRTSIGLFLLLGVAFFLRVANLSEFPPAFLPDEAGSMDFALRHVFHPDNRWLTINPLRTGLDSQPILYSYILRLSTGVFGFSTMGARMSSAIVGTLAIAAVFPMMNEMAGRRTAWITVILMTVYHYHIHWSRIALSNIWTTLLLPLALGFFLRGWRKQQTSGALLAGLCFGFTAYFYTGGYILIFLIVVAMWQVWKKTEDRNQLSIYAGKMLTIAIVIAAPLIVFSIRYPQHFYDRAYVVYGWRPEAIEAALGNSSAYWDYFVHQAIHSFGAYNYFTDTTGFYAPSIPFLIGVSSLFFLVGIFQALQKKQYFPVLWVLIVTIFGGMMTASTPGSSHFISVIPAICWLVSIPINQLVENRKLFWACIFLSAIIIVDLWFYFGIYAANPSQIFTTPFPSIEPYVH